MMGGSVEILVYSMTVTIVHEEIATMFYLRR